MADGEAAAEEAGAEDGDEAAANGAAAPAAAAGGPVKLGFRTFANSREAADYLQEILKKATPHRKLNEVGSKGVVCLEWLLWVCVDAEADLGRQQRRITVRALLLRWQ
jgi:hypothetical protein